MTNKEELSKVIKEAQSIYYKKDVCYVEKEKKVNKLFQYLKQHHLGDNKLDPYYYFSTSKSNMYWPVYLSDENLKDFLTHRMMNKSDILTHIWKNNHYPRDLIESYIAKTDEHVTIPFDIYLSAFKYNFDTTKLEINKTETIDYTYLNNRGCFIGGSFTFLDYYNDPKIKHFLENQKEKLIIPDVKTLSKMSLFFTQKEADIVFNKATIWEFSKEQKNFLEEKFSNYDNNDQSVVLHQQHGKLK